ncbi:hypothetical protein NB311A_11967 [Nitrobacter sp. Nb-311A]|uniref:hypothetical protein n=1 Tax=Nitrobacter sp. Nb-311A TaxID=314253 RepID=UPI00006852CA|nr:hypothetical protein [Nitrobacter sp. Nb-311A]EAQ34457.1 hypothetical protein NB311A_11967 [Nitrobacter sp. Nb-311A]
MNRPARNTPIGYVLCLILAALYSSAAKAVGTDQDFDMACAVTSAAEIATTKPGSDQRNAALQTNFYFLGRLSGRDTHTFWSVVVKGKVAELRERAKNPEMYSRCLDFLTKQL